MSAFKLFAKRFYVKAVHGIGAALNRIGVLKWMEKHQDKRVFHWVRSLFAIYDIDQMIALDVPWWTYRAIDQVDAFLTRRPAAKVFEFGSGASTVWLARRAGTVHSVEHDQPWFELMQSRIADYPGITLVHVPADLTLGDDTLFHSEKEGYAGVSFEAYAKAIKRTDERYDVIVIDGRARPACLSMASDCLTDGGIIVFDNTKRYRYDRAIVKSGLSVTALPGITPSLPYSDKTTLLHVKAHG